MAIALIPYALALLFFGAFLRIAWRYRRAIRMPSRFVWAMRISVLVILAQILIVVLWPARPVWMPATLSIIPFTACMHSAWPVFVEVLLPPAALARWRAWRARPRR